MERRKLLFLSTTIFVFTFIANVSFGASVTNNNYLPYLQVGGARFFNIGKSGSWGANTDLFIPIWQSSFSHLVFTHIRFFDRLSKTLEGNVHLGYRYLSPENDYLYGIYGAFDWKQSKLKNNFTQLTFGLEAWFQKLFIGGNFYQTIDNKSRLIDIDESAAYENIQKTVSITGNGKYEKAMGGADFEIGYEFLKGLVGYVGGYYFGTKNIDTIYGPKAKIAYDWSLEKGKRVLNIFDKLGLEAGIQRDKVRGISWYLSVNFRIGLLPSKNSVLQDVARHMIDPVHRDVDIISSEYSIPLPSELYKFFTESEFLSLISSLGSPSNLQKNGNLIVFADKNNISTLRGLYPSVRFMPEYDKNRVFIVSHRTNRTFFVDASSFGQGGASGQGNTGASGSGASNPGNGGGSHKPSIIKLFMVGNNCISCYHEGSDSCEKIENEEYVSEARPFVLVGDSAEIYKEVPLRDSGNIVGDNKPSYFSIPLKPSLTEPLNNFNEVTLYPPLNYEIKQYKKLSVRDPGDVHNKYTPVTTYPAIDYDLTTYKQLPLRDSAGTATTPYNKLQLVDIVNRPSEYKKLDLKDTGIESYKYKEVPLYDPGEVNRYVPVDTMPLLEQPLTKYEKLQLVESKRKQMSEEEELAELAHQDSIQHQENMNQEYMHTTDGSVRGNILRLVRSGRLGQALDELYADGGPKNKAETDLRNKIKKYIGDRSQGKTGKILDQDLTGVNVEPNNRYRISYYSNLNLSNTPCNNTCVVPIGISTIYNHNNIDIESEHVFSISKLDLKSLPKESSEKYTEVVTYPAIDYDLTTYKQLSVRDSGDVHNEYTPITTYPPLNYDLVKYEEVSLQKPSDNRYVYTSLLLRDPGEVNRYVPVDTMPLLEQPLTKYEKLQLVESKRKQMSEEEELAELAHQDSIQHQENMNQEYMHTTDGSVRGNILRLVRSGRLGQALDELYADGGPKNKAETDLRNGIKEYMRDRSKGEKDGILDQYLKKFGVEKIGGSYNHDNIDIESEHVFSISKLDLKSLSKESSEKYTEVVTYPAIDYDLTTYKQLSVRDSGDVHNEYTPITTYPPLNYDLVKYEEVSLQKPSDNRYVYTPITVYPPLSHNIEKYKELDLKDINEEAPPRENITRLVQSGKLGAALDEFYLGGGPKNGKERKIFNGIKEYMHYRFDYSRHLEKGFGKKSSKKLGKELRKGLSRELEQLEIEYNSNNYWITLGRSNNIYDHNNIDIDSEHVFTIPELDLKSPSKESIEKYTKVETYPAMDYNLTMYKQLHLRDPGNVVLDDRSRYSFIPLKPPLTEPLNLNNFNEVTLYPSLNYDIKKYEKLSVRDPGDVHNKYTPVTTYPPLNYDLGKYSELLLQEPSDDRYVYTKVLLRDPGEVNRYIPVDTMPLLEQPLTKHEKLQLVESKRKQMSEEEELAELAHQDSIKHQENMNGDIV